MALGKGKKKNARGTNPRKTVDAPASKPKGKAGTRKTPRGTTTRSGDK
jgi:hypothetical protein